MTKILQKLAFSDHWNQLEINIKTENGGMNEVTPLILSKYFCPNET
jgi:hypothetical protein